MKREYGIDELVQQKIKEIGPHGIYIVRPCYWDNNAIILGFKNPSSGYYTEQFIIKYKNGEMHMASDEEMQMMDDYLFENKTCDESQMAEIVFDEEESETDL